MLASSLLFNNKNGKKNSEADSFRNMKIKIFYTLEDGHIGRNDAV
jgi:hypothetical protein